MSRIIDNLIAYRILSMLVKPFPETDAYKFGIIDKHGKKLRDPVTEVEKDSYDYLSKLTFNLKKLLNKLPGGDTRLKNIVAALFLIKERVKNNSTEMITESELVHIINQNVILAEETIQVKLFEDGAIVGQGQVVASTEPTNKTGPATSTDIPVYNKKKPPLVKRVSLKQMAVDLNQKAL